MSFWRVLVFQISPGTEAAVPTAQQYRFRYLISGSYFSIPKLQYKVFRGYLHFPILVLVRLYFDIISVPIQVEPKASVKEPNLTAASIAQNCRY